MDEGASRAVIWGKGPGGGTTGCIRCRLSSVCRISFDRPRISERVAHLYSQSTSLCIADDGPSLLRGACLLVYCPSVLPEAKES